MGGASNRPSAAGRRVIAAGIAAWAAAVAWLSVLALPDRRFDMRPVAEDEPAPPDPIPWPAVDVVVPARNEAETLPATLPALLDQDYPGPMRVFVVDDRSQDGTADAARVAAQGRPVTVIEGAPLPPGFVGKVWALSQGVHAGGAPLVLLTDADILHSPVSLRLLVAEAQAADLALVSRMARLRCESWAERLLVPAFVWFFTMLYPLRRVARPGARTAASAGGCQLVRRDALARCGGLAAIRGALIDDVALARLVKRGGGAIRLSLARSQVTSVRRYPALRDVWAMVRRSAFTQLRHSWSLLGAVLGLMALLFAVPPAAVAAGAALWAAGLGAGPEILAAGLVGWAAMALAYRPAPRFFGLGAWHAALLPVVAGLYAGMTLDSALRSRTGDAMGWR